MKIKRLKEVLKRRVIIKVYIPVIMMVIGLVVGVVGIVAFHSYFVFGIGMGAVAAIALLGIFKYEIK